MLFAFSWYAGNIVALLHAFFSNLPHEWLESTHTVIKHLRPVTSVAMMRIAFRIMGPLLPRLAFARPLFMKVSGFQATSSQGMQYEANLLLGTYDFF